MPLEQLEKELGTEERWVEAKPIPKELGSILKASGGPYYKGSSHKSGFCITQSYTEAYLDI